MSLKEDDVPPPLSKEPSLSRIILDNRDLFRSSLPNKLPKDRFIKHLIDTGDYKPIN